MSQSRPPIAVIFAAALELPAAPRAAYLAEACAGDDLLRQQVEALLRSHDEAGTFMDKPGAPDQPEEGPLPAAAPGVDQPSGDPAGPTSSARNCSRCGQPLAANARNGVCWQCFGKDLGAAMPSTEGPAESTVPGTVTQPADGENPVADSVGQNIGRYKLLQQIGEGGCGVVYLAAQAEPIKRRVALKVIKPGMDTKQVLGRFEAERQVLALMDHPNIAKVLDAGATASGRPYFVMELVHGIPATRYCDEHKLTTRQRLELFIKICSAVQHAHQKSIIHRDIKPSNILVADHDGVPVPKVIDFGIAKATAGQELTTKTVFTAFEQFMGTPAYMSPEQASLGGLDIDTRSDIYSLGVLLYELLTGKTPFEAKELYAAGLDEIRRIIREVEPPKPSTRLSTLNLAEQTLLAGQRQSDPPKLRGLIRDDLDWIVMKCLEKDRTRRYETANGLAADLKRHLENEPVIARPPRRMYQFQKMVRRNRLAFAVGTAIATILILGIAASLWQAQRANREAVRASSEARRAQAAEAEANERLAESQAISKFMVGVFQRPDPSRDGRTITVAETMDRAVTNLDHDLAAQPGVRAQLEQTLGRTYYGLGLYRETVPLWEKVRDYDLQTFGLEHTNTLKAMNDLANAYCEADRTDEALKLGEATFQLYRKVLGPDHPDTLKAMSNLARCHRAAGHPKKALSLVQEVLALRRKVLGPEHPDTLATMANLAGDYLGVGNNDAAIKLYEEVLPLQQKVLGPESPGTLATMGNLGSQYYYDGRNAEALKLLEETLKLRRQVLGPEHPFTLEVMRNLASACDDAGRKEEALKLREEALQLDRKVLRPAHPYTIMVMADLASSYSEAGREEEAIKLREELLPMVRAFRGPEHPDTLIVSTDLAVSYDAVGRKAEALKLREEVLRMDRQVLRPDHPYKLLAMIDLAISYAEAGRPEEAVKLRQELLPLLRNTRDTDPDTLSVMNDLAFTMAISDTETSWNGTNAVQLAEAAVAGTSRKNADYLDTLAAADAQTQQFDRARTVEQEAISLLKTEKDKPDYTTRLQLYQAHKPCREAKKSRSALESQP